METPEGAKQRRIIERYRAGNRELRERLRAVLAFAAELPRGARSEITFYAEGGVGAQHRLSPDSTAIDPPADGDLQAAINAWQVDTFPRATSSSILAHLRRELDELTLNPTDPSEAADNAILLFGLAGYFGYDLLDAVRDKFAVLCERKEWGEPDEEGVVEHVRDLADEVGTAIKMRAQTN